MEDHLRFKNAIFCSCNCSLLRFSAHNLSLLLIFLHFYSKYNPRGLIFGGGGLYMEGVFHQKLVPEFYGTLVNQNKLKKLVLISGTKNALFSFTYMYNYNI